MSTNKKGFWHRLIIYFCKEIADAAKGYATDKNYYNNIRDMKIPSYNTKTISDITQLHAKYPEAIDFFVEADKARVPKCEDSMFRNFGVENVCQLYEKYPEAMKKLYTITKNSNGQNRYLWRDISSSYTKIPEKVVAMLDKNPKAFEDLSKTKYFVLEDGVTNTRTLDITEMSKFAEFYTDGNKKFISDCITNSAGKLNPETIKALTTLNPKEFDTVAELIKDDNMHNIYNIQYKQSVNDYIADVKTKTNAYRNCPDLYKALSNPEVKGQLDMQKITQLTQAINEGLKSGRYTDNDLQALTKRLNRFNEQTNTKISNLMEVNREDSFYTPSQMIELLMIDAKSPEWNFFENIDDGYFVKHPSIEDLLVDKLNNSTDIEDVSYYSNAINKHYKDNGITSKYSNIEELTTGRLQARDKFEEEVKAELANENEEIKFGGSGALGNFSINVSTKEIKIQAAMQNYDNYNTTFKKAGFSDEFIKETCMNGDADIYNAIMKKIAEDVKYNCCDKRQVGFAVYEALREKYGKAQDITMVDKYFKELTMNWNVDQDLINVMENPKDVNSLNTLKEKMLYLQN